MAVCARDPSHVYPGHNKSCPWCAVATTAVPSPAPQQVAVPAVASPTLVPGTSVRSTVTPAPGRRRLVVSAAASVWIALGLAVAAFVGIFLVELAVFGNTTDPGVVPALVSTPFIVAVVAMIIALVLLARTRR